MARALGEGIRSTQSVLGVLTRYGFRVLSGYHDGPRPSVVLVDPHDGPRAVPRVDKPRPFGEAAVLRERRPRK